MFPPRQQHRRPHQLAQAAAAARRNHIAIQTNARYDAVADAWRTTDKTMQTCVAAGCKERRNTECKFALCKTHCVAIPVKCGTRPHDRTTQGDHPRLLYPNWAHLRLPDFQGDLQGIFKLVQIVFEYPDRGIAVDALGIAVYGTVRLDKQQEVTKRNLRVWELDTTAIEVDDGNEWKRVTYLTAIAVRGNGIRLRCTTTPQCLTLQQMKYITVERQVSAMLAEWLFGAEPLARTWASNFPHVDYDEYVARAWMVLYQYTPEATRKAYRDTDGRWANFVHEQQQQSSDMRQRLAKLAENMWAEDGSEGEDEPIDLASSDEDDDDDEKVTSSHDIPQCPRSSPAGNQNDARRHTPIPVVMNSSRLDGHNTFNGFLARLYFLKRLLSEFVPRMYRARPSPSTPPLALAAVLRVWTVVRGLLHPRSRHLDLQSVGGSDDVGVTFHGDRIINGSTAHIFFILSPPLACSSTDSLPDLIDLHEFLRSEKATRFVLFDRAFYFKPAADPYISNSAGVRKNLASRGDRYGAVVHEFCPACEAKAKATAPQVRARL
ncbi:hypothetical protein EXIGLDRAFT_780767 [Exidia glandulosa HHB12029]|uniref:Uncharacterized protein n=1 Tax=Exidia glandulosa HHB12029 TaxID=1314781 RepID=A0A165BGH5_EXIGL|nr:hypothetical protein EXIGLDRAFT_780767 [Exidia glandulosa HHB12029]